MAGRALLKRIKVRNFKSFEDLELDLGRLNVVIGANAAGKSNLVQVFGFLRDICNEGLDNAVSLQGGIEYTRSFGRGKKNITIELEIEFGGENLIVPRLPRQHTDTRLQTTNAKWTLELKIGRNASLAIVEDSWIFGISAYNNMDTTEQSTLEDLVSGTIAFTRKNNRMCFEIDHPYEKQIRKSIDHYREPYQKKQLFVHSYVAKRLFPAAQDFFGKAGIYDFDPRTAKEPASIRSMPGLIYNGSNLAVEMQRILADKHQRRKLNNIVFDLAPFVKSISTTKSAKAARFSIDEHIEDISDKTPSHILSNGTVNAMALVVALYCENHALIVIEEPDRSMHPSLMSKIADMIKETSERKQVVITTHNPELVKYADLESLVLVTRNNRGVSDVSRPSQEDDVKEFLKNDIGIEELYVQNIIGG